MEGLAALVAVALAVLAAAVADAESYYAGNAAVKNRLPVAGGMALVCRELGVLFITDFTVVPRDGRRVAELLVRPGQVGALHLEPPGQLHVANMSLLDSRWPEAMRCRDRAAGICRVVVTKGRAK